MSDREKVLPFESSLVEDPGPESLRFPDDPLEARAWLEAKLLEGLNDEGSIEMTPEAWVALREEALERTTRLRQVS